MSLGRVTGFLVSPGVCTGVFVAFLWLTSAGCSSSGNSGDGSSGTGPMYPGDGGTSATKDSGGGTVPGRDSGSGPQSDGGPHSDSGSGPCTTNTGPISGTVGAGGGSISRLVFAVVGDTRPANEDDVGGYPTSIITKIFQDIEAQSPHPPFVSARATISSPRPARHSTAARAGQPLHAGAQGLLRVVLPRDGQPRVRRGQRVHDVGHNNCGPSNPGGATPNYNAFMSQMLAPISQTKPYYAINVNATDSSWTAKFVITAANAWDTAQQSWLTTTLAQKTTYTFVVRHEASDATPPLPPGVAGVDAVISRSTRTRCSSSATRTRTVTTTAPPQVVVIGNGGAPLSSKDYGYGLFSQRCDGAIVGRRRSTTMSGATDSQFHFVITPKGAITK